MLQEQGMVATIARMPKTEQVRIDVELTRKARICATALYGESLPEYIDRLVRAGVERDLPDAHKKIGEMAKPSEPKRKKNGGHN